MEAVWQMSWMEVHRWLGTQGRLALPFGLALWIAWGDLKTQRIPNYLTFGAALAGLLYSFIFHGLSGLGQGAAGLLLGLALLILPYCWGGMGAGDVKALAALGAWLGPGLTLALFCYMGIAGGVMALGILWRQRLLGQKMRQAWSWLLNAVLCRPDRIMPPPPPDRQIKGIPYGVATAMGMAALLILGG
jgi:prepilin peptidase CpaA